ncbi:MAG: GntR family transcriptional regulator, transcriptional repressor for pyruvate dehydrogenase complex [Baekduia sp.]|nr:GntR family transcriptional regulator, transcriptional repressor for pyruvate dehydrogenase complex [Baekduia sp.]
MGHPCAGWVRGADHGPIRVYVPGVFTPVQTRRTFEEAAEQIADKVRVGELRVGDKLPGERALAAQMQISRPTLREAVKVLVDAGLLEVRRGPGGGMFVATDVVGVEVVRQRSSLRLSEVAGVLEARRMLEPRVAQLAAVRATEDDFAALQRSIDGMRNLVDAGRALKREDHFLQLDVQFHLALARASGNATVESLMRVLFRQLEIARDMAMHLPLVPEWTIEIHERTVAAVRSGDLAEVEAVMDEHVGQLEKTWEEETARALVRPLPDFLMPAHSRSKPAA